MSKKYLTFEVSDGKLTVVCCRTCKKNTRLDFFVNNTNFYLSIRFSGSNMKFLPTIETNQWSPWMTMLILIYCGLKEISKSDLCGFKNLKFLDLSGNKLKTLPADLFSGTKFLEEAYFEKNQITKIGVDLLKPLDINKIKAICFENNPAINAVYCSKDYYLRSHYASVSLDEMNNLIRDTCNPLFENNFLLRDIQNIFRNDNFKDLAIDVQNKKFKAHKLLLAARSPVFADMIAGNQDVKEIKLIDIGADTFQLIMNFIYTDEMPADDSNWFNVYAAAHKFKIEKLKDFAEDKLLAMLDVQNAYEILVLGNKCSSEDLMEFAFAAIEESLPKAQRVQLNPNWINQPEEIKKLIEATQKVDPKDV